MYSAINSSPSTWSSSTQNSAKKSCLMLISLSIRYSCSTAHAIRFSPSNTSSVSINWPILKRKTLSYSKMASTRYSRTKVQRRSYSPRYCSGSLTTPPTKTRPSGPIPRGSICVCSPRRHAGSKYWQLLQCLSFSYSFSDSGSAMLEYLCMMCITALITAIIGKTI